MPISRKTLARRSCLTPGVLIASLFVMPLLAGCGSKPETPPKDYYDGPQKPVGANVKSKKGGGGD